MLLLFWSGLTQGTLLWAGPDAHRIAVVAPDFRRTVVV